MKCLISMLAIALACAVSLPAGAQAAFGLNDFDVVLTGEDGAPVTQAGSHPFAFTVSMGANFSGEETEGRLEDLFFEPFPGLVADTVAYPRCTMAAFLEVEYGTNACPLETAIGISANTFSQPGNWVTAPVFNLSPPPGVLLRLGFRLADTTNIVVDLGVSPYPPYNAVAEAHLPLQPEEIFGAKVQLWGDPADPAHDGLRGACGVYEATSAPGDVDGFEFESPGASCPAPQSPRSFLTLPTSCDEPLPSFYEAISWEGDWDVGAVLTHDFEGHPQSLTGCKKLAFTPSMVTQPTAMAAQSPTGLDLSIDVHDDGLVYADGIAQSQIREVALALPSGMTPSPAAIQGLEACSEEDLESEALEAAPGEGCPAGSQIGTVEVESPLIEEPVMGAVYQATPYANLAGDSPLAFYIVLENSNLGIVVKQVGAVEREPETGQLILFVEDVPQLPFSHFRLNLFEGGKSPLISPPLCGSYTSTAEMTPWSGKPPITTTSAFSIVSGPHGGPCPSGVQPAPPDVQTGPVASAPPPAQGRPHRRRCAKGKRKARRHGKVRCVRKHHRRHRRGQRR